MFLYLENVFVELLVTILYPVRNQKHRNSGIRLQIFDVNAMTGVWKENPRRDIMTEIGLHLREMMKK
jgi:hypothetical protein